MLRFALKDENGCDVLLPPPLSLRIDVDEGAPADSLYAVFPDTETDRLTEIRVFDGDELIFRGDIDEEERRIGSSGRFLRISARSLAARLLDNEAAPSAFDHPSARLICERFVFPHGIETAENDDSVYFGELSVPKGTSCWSALKSFCVACYSSVPRIGGSGELYLKGIQNAKSVRFGSSKGCIRYSEISESFKRCEEISVVRVKTTGTDGYGLPIENTEAVRRGISRERYLNAALTDNPLRRAEAMIKAGEAKAYTLKLRCPGRLTGCEGCTASVEGVPGGREGLYISALRYRLSDSGEYTDVILKRRKS